jgi:signal transduction histidine kinase
MRSGTSLRSRKEFVKIVKGVFSVCYGNFCRATLRLVKMKRPSGLSLLAGALLVLMPALAVLQFRWVGQVSDAEQERMRRNVEIAAQQFRESFSQEVGRAWVDLQVRAAAVRDSNWEGYADRYDQWSKEATHPGLVRNVYIVIVEGGQPVARRWDPEARAFALIAWPAALEPWKADFAAELADFNAAQAFPQNQGPQRFQGQDALIIGPLRGQVSTNLRSGFNPDTGSRRLTTELAFGFTVMELNVQYVRETFLPDLVQRHFTHGDSYRVSVVDSDNPKDVIYRSDTNAATDAAQADACQGVFPRFNFGPPRGAPQTGRDGRPATPERCAALNNPAVAARSGIDELPGRWRLLVQHQSGSLETAVAGARRRNIALSFGVLLLLTLSIGLLAVASRKAQRLAEQQIEFVAGISHELRTPVAVIRSAAENLSQGVVGNTERVKRYGQMIEGEARRLGEMVERVLQYAGIESGLGFGGRTSLAPAEIIQSAVDSAMPLLGPESVDIHRDIPELLPPVMGDPAALRSAVQNLVANAVKYGGRDRWVGIRAEHVHERRRSEVRISVSDHGSGIPASELPHIFEPFYRGGDALARQIHGNGLGLSLVKRIVAAHGGRVTVETKAGVGSSFSIWLPAAEPHISSASVASEVRAAAHS